MNTQNPKISIITVVRNGEKYIEHAIKSIVDQSYDSIEYIVIDGASTDNTVGIIKKYSDRIAHWISEKDKGIYDAMNKGVALATGDWLLFINSDDYLADNSVIEEMAPYLDKSQSHVIYGKAKVIYAPDQESNEGAEWESSRYKFRNIRMNLSHQATFHARELFRNRQFDTRFKIAGDYDLLLSYLNRHDAIYVPIVVAKRRAVGVSASASTYKLLKETRRAQINNHIYKSIPSIDWLLTNFRLYINHRFIKFVGIERKNALKKQVQMLRRSSKTFTF